MTPMNKTTLFLAALLLLGAGCVRTTPAPTPVPPVLSGPSFGVPVTMEIATSVTYADGLDVQLKEINDSRCPADVVCIWQGELSALLGIQGGAVGADTNEVRLGTVNGTEVTKDGYTFSLKEAMTSSISLVVVPATTEEEPSAYPDLIRVDAPKAGDLVTSPLRVTGEARGNWYFEASFPVTLKDANGKVLVAHYAQAEGEWMTTEFVPFLSTLEFAKPTTATGTLVLQNDNPSGLPELSKQIEIPVRFSSETAAKPDCKRSGCSGQICSDQDMMSDCMYRPEYACYKTATCERQKDGACGWTETSDLKQCLQNPPAV